MKIIKISPLLTILFLVSCNQNEMKISRTDKTIVSELIEQSPIYITKNKDGTFEVNENNRIGNTDWVFSIESNLPIGDILPDIQRLITKKYAAGMHPDHKKVYFIYLDTISNKPAYLPIDGLEFITEKPTDSLSLSFDKNISTEKFIQKMVKITSADTLAQKTKVFIY